jgi:hypothetical protein
MRKIILVLFVFPVLRLHIPKGYKLQVYYNDGEVRGHFANDSKIKVTDADGHDNHLHFELIKERQR